MVSGEIAGQVVGGYSGGVMKKITSMLLAVVSTIFLFAGATQAAEKFDGLARTATPTVSGSALELANGPCVIIPDEDVQ
jgi:hypothetical protein